MLAEDAADIRDLMRFHLMMDGRFDLVGESGDGDDLVALVQREQPEVLISDMSLPGMNGLGLIETLRRECPACKILVFSGFAMASREMVSEAGADAVMEKTVHSFEEVVERAAALCAASA